MSLIKFWQLKKLQLTIFIGCLHNNQLLVCRNALYKVIDKIKKKFVIV